MDIKCRLLSKHSFERTLQHGARSLWVTINLYKKNCLHLSHGMKNIHRSCINDKNIGERLFAPATLKGF